MTGIDKDTHGMDIFRDRVQTFWKDQLLHLPLLVQPDCKQCVLSVCCMLGITVGAVSLTNKIFLFTRSFWSGRRDGLV